MWFAQSPTCGTKLPFGGSGGYMYLSFQNESPGRWRNAHDDAPLNETKKLPVL